MNLNTLRSCLAETENIHQLHNLTEYRSNNPITYNSNNPIYSINCKTGQFDNSLIGFQFVPSSTDNSIYFNKYTCDSGLAATNQNTIIKKTQNKSNNPNLLDITFDCDAKPLTGINTTILSDNIIYEYTCGDINLKNIKNQNIPAIDGTNISALSNQIIKCDNDTLLTGFNLSTIPNNSILNYNYTYKCGTPTFKNNINTIKSNNITNTIEGFNVNNNCYLYVIIFIVIIIIMFIIYKN